ncbi:MFS general substrate transporter [Patellaria atrata CBS 101060]|uniref:MFS general substrate transporter n=1 Tax=Patellaria atrata CBS 101060 TaxID=1346257 RepID=A0A9P4VPU2_9PEZI|nr:MFS general substrate transporter [Patellaria atrata CBS 101060]
MAHLVQSHAHEEDIPGTVNLKAVEGDDTGYGQALFPVPCRDPNDPLQWPNYKKTMILIICAVYSFLGNAALVGPSPYILIYAEEFHITPTTASNLISYPNLAFGFGALLLVPLYLKIGRRPVMLMSMIIFCAGLIGASRCTTYETLMVARVFHCFGSGVCEALPVQLVNDIFFIHERGKRLGYYTVCLCLGATGPLYAGYMLAGGYSWRLYFYVVFAFACALTILAFFFVEETSYDRQAMKARLGVSDSPVRGDASSIEKEGNTAVYHEIEVPVRKSFVSTLKPWSPIVKEASFFGTMLRSFTYFFVPSVFWVIVTYGIYIGLGALAFNFTFPIKIVAPPYNWSQTNSGLIAVANAAGYLLAVPFTSSSDRVAAHYTKKNNMIREAEMRLIVLLPAMLIAPAGLIVYGLTAERNLHWFGYFAGVAMCNWGAYFYFTFTLAYAVDSYTANMSEMLIAMNLGKQAISFGMGLYLLDWILEIGYAKVIAGIFCGVLLANNLALIPFMLWGKKIRVFTSKTGLARLHNRHRTVGETH